MNETPKAVKRKLRELAGIAHEKELRTALGRLAEDFGRWQGGRIDSFELSDLIHKFHQGPNRTLFARYSQGMERASVAHAIATGILDRGQVPADVLEDLEGAIEFFESNDA